MSNADLRVGNIAPPPSRHRLRASREYGVLGLLVATIVVVQIVNRGFLSAGNVLDMLIQCSPFAIMACGMTFVILTREIDISVGSMVGLLAALAGIACAGSRMGLPVWVAVLATCAAGILLGLANGVLVTYGRVPSIIVTLGMLIVLRGVTELLMAGRWITDLPQSIRYLGTGRLLGIIRTVLVFLRLGDEATYWERAIQGVFILAAVLADRIASRRTEREVRS